MISRQKLIEKISKLPILITEDDDFVDLDAVLYAINSQPPADQWIPCSERLPKEDGKYLVTIHGTCSIATNTLYFNVDRQEWCEHDDFGFKYTYCNITAWMPLPEPYKGGRVDE